MTDQNSNPGTGKTIPLTLKKKRGKKPLVICMWVMLTLLVALGGLLGVSYHQSASMAAQADKAQSNILKNKAGKISTEKDKTATYNYGNDNDGIPNATEFKKLQSLKTPMTHWGYAASPAEPGLPNPLRALPIYEGASNQTLAWGYGTPNPGYVMGKSNNVIAAHNFADNVTYASPLQQVDVSQKPKIYQTNGKKVYTYELTERQRLNVINDDNDRIAYTKAVQPTKEDRITIVTCDVPNMIVNLNTEYRIVVSGKLIETTDYNKASDDIKGLFPAF